MHCSVLQGNNGESDVCDYSDWRRITLGLFVTFLCASGDFNEDNLFYYLSVTVKCNNLSFPSVKPKKSCFVHIFCLGTCASRDSGQSHWLSELHCWIQQWCTVWNAAGIKDDRWFINTLGRLAVICDDTNQCFCLSKHGTCWTPHNTIGLAMELKKRRKLTLIHQNTAKYFNSSLSL